MENANGLEGKGEALGNQLAINGSSPSKKLPGNNNCCVPLAQNNSDAIEESDQGVNVPNKPGSSYSLRSQSKRPINSLEPDQSREPLTKKQAKGSKQSSAVKLTQESERPQNERVASEIALNVDLIVESLFRYMDYTTLKSCRLVCRKWKYFGAKELQRRRDATIELSFGYVIDKSEKSARSLLAVMKNSDLNTFPCSSFDVTTEELSSPRIQNFFSVAEARNPIKQLSLKLMYDQKKLSWKESTLLDDLRDLFRQVPNLETLEIFFFPPLHWVNGLNTLDSGFCYLQNSPYLLPKLTSLELFGSSIPRKLFEHVMDAAVNLQSYAGDLFSPELLGYFVDGNGKHRIHLLKHLRFLYGDAFVEVMERLMTQHGDNLKLESFYFHFSPERNDRAEFWSRASVIINQLLHSSASTMSTLRITPLGFLAGLAIPRLPNLHTISLLLDDVQNETDDDFFFPPGFSLAKNFPNLYKVNIPWGSPLKSLEMLSITEPVTSVYHIWIGDTNEIDDGTRARLYAAFPSVVQIEEGFDVNVNYE